MSCGAILSVPFRGKMDIYHPTTYLRMPMVRARRVVATHHDCTHERFPELFPDAKKVLWARKMAVSPGGRHHLRLRVVPPGPAALLRRRSGQDACDPSWSQSASAQRGSRRRACESGCVAITCSTLACGRPSRIFTGLLQAFHETRLQDSLDLLVLGGGALTAQEKTLIAESGA